MSDWPSPEENAALGRAAGHEAREAARKQTKGRAKAESFWLNQRHSKLWKKLNRISDPSVRKDFVLRQHLEMAKDYYDPKIDPKKFRQKLQ